MLGVDCGGWRLFVYVLLDIEIICESQCCKSSIKLFLHIVEMRGQVGLIKLNKKVCLRQVKTI